MIDRTDTISFKLRFLIAGLIVIAAVIFLSFMLAGFAEANPPQPAKPKQAQQVIPAGMSDSPNAVSSGMAEAADEFGETFDTLSVNTERTLLGGSQTVADTTKKAGRGIIKVGKIAASGAYTGATTIARCYLTGVGMAASLIIDYNRTVAGAAVENPVVSAVIQPSANTAIPIIDPRAPTIFAAHTALATVAAVNQPAPQPVAPGAGVWPISGEITTYFGVPHWPFQATHSGIDISDGKAPGITPIKPFKPGKVIETTRSAYGLGNHIVVDHGGGLTSVYGHLASIAVQNGQEVDSNTVLGLEGSTGASTGTHLHLEIRVNGIAVDPRQYINGMP